MSEYQKKKAAARSYAQDWQEEFSESSWTWEEVATMQDTFLRIARRYGLVREFRENGII